MRILLKLVLLGVVVFLFLFCSGNPGKRMKGISAPFSSEMKNSHKDVNITNTRTYKDRSDDPVVTVETMVREMRNNNPPPDPEEIRRQRNLARSANVEWIKESTREYSPDSWYLFMQYENLPLMTEASTDDDGTITTQKAVETFHYLRGRTRLDLLASMETNVHEIAHAYFDQNVFRYVRENNLIMDWDNVHGYIYISPSKGFYITYPLKSMFPSRELVEVISADLRTYRFETYIDGTTSTQSEGVIGLLNELYAYYTGSRYCFDMLDPYKTAAGSEAAGLFEWVTRTQSTMSAFYEFDFFISEYLLYMKKNYAANYEKLKLYRPFTEAYKTIYTLYKELINNYQERIRDEVKLLNSSGNAEAKTEKGWLWVRVENSNVSSGAPIFSEYRETLSTVLESRRYWEIDGDFITR
ncbi:MAG: hypothetical protein MUO72_03360 [Bacteroidales bacterium]|nr:hypothetical protein [Bacteroidales bacterium]